MLRRSSVFGISSLLSLLLFVTPVSAAEDNASALVAAFQNSMLQAMKRADALGMRGRYDMLLPVVERTFHVKLMVRVVTGRHWTSGNKTLRQRLIREFRRMSVSTLATFLDGYDGERFEILGVRAGSKNRHTVMVDTRVVRNGKGPVDITYVAINDGRRWWLVDVLVAGGISELLVRRSEFARVLANGGFKSLIAALDNRSNRILVGRTIPDTSSAQR